MTTTTDKGLTDEELLAIADAATAGPWFHRQAGGESSAGDPYDWIADAPDRGQHRKIIVSRGVLYGGVPDYAFIATFDPPMVRALIERARAAETRALAMEEALRAIANQKPTNDRYGLRVGELERASQGCGSDHSGSRDEPAVAAWVLQRNDFPYAVYFDHDKGKAALANKREEERQWREENKHVADVRVFWNLYKTDHGAIL